MPPTGNNVLAPRFSDTVNPADQKATFSIRELTPDAPQNAAVERPVEKYVDTQGQQVNLAETSVAELQQLAESHAPPAFSVGITYEQPVPPPAPEVSVNLEKNYQTEITNGGPAVVGVRRLYVNPEARNNAELN